MWDGTTMCHAFLGAGSAQPDTMVHVSVATEELEAPHSVGGDVHFCVFAEVLVSARSLVLEPGRESTR